jgi:hypothetical protein
LTSPGACEKEAAMEHVISHQLDIPTAKKVADRAFEEYKTRFEKYEPTFRWISDRKAELGFSAKGFSVKGSMEVAEKKIAVDLDVPFLLRPFKGMAMDVIDREVKRWIAKAEAGEI